MSEVQACRLIFADASGIMTAAEPGSRLAANAVACIRVNRSSKP